MSFTYNDQTENLFESAMKSLIDVYTTSNHVHECQTYLNEITLYSKSELHLSLKCFSNRIADEIARIDANLIADYPDQFCGITFYISRHITEEFSCSGIWKL